jgi:hypothetical protein
MAKVSARTDLARPQKPKKEGLQLEALLLYFRSA